MEIIDKIMNEIQRDTIKARFAGHWHVEGLEREKNKLCKKLEKSLGARASISCVHVRRYPTEIDSLQLGRAYRESAKLYLLKIEIGIAPKPRFGGLKG